jgi:hypothetical protein
MEKTCTREHFVGRLQYLKDKKERGEYSSPYLAMLDRSIEINQRLLIGLFDGQITTNKGNRYDK